jgi:hypothetical protein
MIWIDEDEESLLLCPILEGVRWEKDWPCMCCAPLGLSCLCNVSGMDPEEQDYREKSWFGKVIVKFITNVTRRRCIFGIFRR